MEKDFFDREKDSEIDTEVILERIFMRFYKIARQLGIVMITDKLCQ